MESLPEQTVNKLRVIWWNIKMRNDEWNGSRWKRMEIVPARADGRGRVEAYVVFASI